MKLKILFIVSFIFCGQVIAQQDTLRTIKKDTLLVKDVVVNSKEIQKITWNTDPLSPSKAAFYSAIFPGLGQIYNKSYWKTPIVWSAIGISIYFYLENDKQYKRYRDAYKHRLDGYTDDEFYTSPRVSDEGLRRAQQFYQRNKEISLLVVVGFYVLNIIEANVDAHLKQYNVDERLAIEPFLHINELNHKPQYGLTLNFKF